MKFVPKQLVDTDDASRGKATPRTIAKDVLAVILFLIVAYVVLGWIGILVAEFIPDSWERKLGQISHKESVTLKPTNVLYRAQVLLDRLREGESLRELDYRLIRLPIKGANAVAVPGGWIGVSPELAKQVATDIGLAFVLAHELGHHQYRHALRALGRSLLLYSAAALFGGNANFLTSALDISESRYSRKQEREADEFALRLVHRKFGTTDGATEFFRWVSGHHTEHRVQKYFGTHPLTEDRIAYLRELGAELDGAE